MQVHGNAPELDSSYFLDRLFWLEQLAQSPAGVVAAVSRAGRPGVSRGADDDSAVATLRFSAAALFASKDSTRISSGLYLFKDGRWSVFQPPQAARTATSAPTAGPATRKAPPGRGSTITISCSAGRHSVSA
jgi:hypothetical protein